MLYTIGEMAKVLGVQPSTLRYYDQEGLLPFVERSNGGIRMFTDKDYEGLKVIDYLKRSGLSIKEIRSFMEMATRGDESLEERLNLFKSRKEVVLRQIEEMQETLDLLEYKCWYYETAIEKGSEKAVRSIPEDKIPKKHQLTKKRLDILFTTK